MNVSPRGRAVARFFYLLALIVWLGGLCFVGIAAPAIAKVAETVAASTPAIARQMIGAMLVAFTPVGYVCALLALAGWYFDAPTAGRSSKQWRIQGGAIAAMLVLALAAGQVILSKMLNLQPTVLSSLASHQVTEATSQFKALHGQYGALTGLVMLFGLVSLGCFAARSVRETAA